MGEAETGPGGVTRARVTRERILDAAYGLFARQGVAQVGIDTVVERSGCCKASLYNQFGSKDGLALAFLDRREERWTRGWLESEIARRATTPGGRLLAVFDVFDEWFRSPGFEGCSFVNVLLESAEGSAVRRAAADHLERIRGVLRGLAQAEGLDDPERFVHVWHILMKGSIVTAGEGHRDAARYARGAAEMVLAGWQRQ